MKRVFIVHCWDGSPRQGWYPWLKKELEKKGFSVKAPAMPGSENPKISRWVPFLAKLVKKADKDTFFVGHSIGCQAILRYLQAINEKIGGAVFVAGWFHLLPEATEEEGADKIARPWLKTRIDFKRIGKSRFTAIFSDNDPYVPLSDSKIFRKKLGARIIIEHKKGHFSAGRIPSVLREITRMAK